MRNNRVLKSVEAGIHRASKLGLYASASFMMMLLVSVVVDVVTRLARLPVKGTYDLGEILMVCITYTAIACTQQEKGHIRVDILLGRLPKRIIQILDTITISACAIVSLLIAYTMAGRVLSIISGTGPAPVSLLLSIPIWPFLLIISIGSLLLGLEFIIDAVRSFWRALHGGPLIIPVTGAKK